MLTLFPFPSLCFCMRPTHPETLLAPCAHLNTDSQRSQNGAASACHTTVYPEIRLHPCRDLPLSVEHSFAASMYGF